MAIIELDQACETPVSTYQRGAFRVRYAYARAKDARLSNLRGEDYLVFRVEPDWLAFAVCDGVGSSFFGGLAAQIVGECLLTWLSSEETRKLLNANPPTETALASLRRFLDQQVTPASQLVARKDISGLSNQFMRSAYQEKRKKYGSQSNFVCGLVDAKSQHAWLFTLGDASLRAWKDKSELPLKLARASAQSWSTQHGIVGDLHFCPLSLDDMDTLIAYSDGLNPSETWVSPRLISNDLEKHITNLGKDSKSDDISFIEVHLMPEIIPSLDDIVPLVREAVSSTQLPAQTTHTPRMSVFGWVIGLVLFLVGGFGGLIGGYTLQAVVHQFGSTPTLTATTLSSATPIPSQTIAHTITIPPTVGLTATETETMTPTFTLTVTLNPVLTSTPSVTPIP